MAFTFASEHLLDALDRSRRILATTHANPDGDALGSLTAFARIMQARGKELRLYCLSPLPDHLTWLPLPSPLTASLDALEDWQPDTVVLVDCADEKRAGEAIRELVMRPKAERSFKTVCIDHHVGNSLFADFSWADPAYCATGAMMGELARYYGLPLTADLGEDIYLALVSDTGSFTYANTNAQALEMASEIVRGGLCLASFSERSNNNWSLGRMHLWGQLMREVRMECDGSVVVSIVTDDHLRRFNQPASALEDFASWLRRLKGVKVVLFVRTAPRGSKVSLRSMGDVDVREIAASLGGGGHTAAAGVDMAGPPEEAAALALKAICRAMGLERSNL